MATFPTFSRTHLPPHVARLQYRVNPARYLATAAIAGIALLYWFGNSGAWTMPLLIAATVISLAIDCADTLGRWRKLQKLRQRVMVAGGRVCGECAYDLSGLGDGGVCPECGGTFDIARERERWRAAGVDLSHQAAGRTS